ncbi:hypothetical protein M408DRAFT_222637 [Serendipita vermifera MAFF 305830]|uniref:Protein kinase domain-containing protein n=1 Tax=Serendipita vermifera MAFF 305830 TaxID=933852 RepID=A0A0C3AZ67_SERVB|nr:hypothetical protein M408DRAFT_222637 [Serendipita vermifera MAFF 305830]
MDPFEHIQEAPDLSGQVVVLDGKPIFTGSYSCVYKGELREDGQLVAIKVINAVRGSALHTMRRKLLRERTAWGALDHPNILPLYGFADDNKLFEPFGALISPWMQQGDAVDFLAENQDLLTDEDKVELWRDVVEGVNYLHSFNPQLVHGDLKPRNILIDDSGHARICDFGLVRVYLEGGSSGFTTTTNHTGTERYLAYELVIAAEDACPTVASDVWAVGCIGLEFVFSQPPYSARKGNYGGAIYADIRAGIPPATRPDDIAHHLDSLWIYLELCWGPDPDKRPSAAALSVWLQALLEHSSKPIEEHSLSEIQTNNEEEVIGESLEEDSKISPCR